MADGDGFSAEHERAIAALIDAIVPPSADGRMPAGRDLDLVAHIERAARTNPMLRPVVEYGLSAIGEIAARTSPPDWAAALREFTANDQFFLPAFLFLVYGGYYQHERVATALGMEPRAPHPTGHAMGADDWSLLDPVRARRRSTG